MCWMICLCVLTAGILLPLDVQAQTDDALTVAAKQVAEKFVQSADAKRGEVADLDSEASPKTLYISLGLKDGVREGQLLEIASKGDPIVVGGETIGFKETPVGTAEIRRVQNDRLCMATVKTIAPGVAITKGSLAYLKPVPGTLAISTFLRPDNVATMMGQEFADKLGVALQATGRFQLVERSRMDPVLKELGLSLNDLFDPTKAARLGKQLQAKGIVLGTITPQNDCYTINARVVDVETGVQVASTTVTCPHSTEIDGKFGQTVGTTPPPPPPDEVLIPPLPETKKLVTEIKAVATASTFGYVGDSIHEDASVGRTLVAKSLVIGLFGQGDPAGYVTFRLGGEWEKCHLEFGVQDLSSREASCGVAVMLDAAAAGKPARVVYGSMTKIDLDVTGRDVLRVEFRGCKQGNYIYTGNCWVSK